MNTIQLLHTPTINHSAYNGFPDVVQNEFHAVILKYGISVKSDTLRISCTQEKLDFIIQQLLDLLPGANVVKIKDWRNVITFREASSITLTHPILMGCIVLDTEHRASSAALKVQVKILSSLHHYPQIETLLSPYICDKRETILFETIRSINNDGVPTYSDFTREKKDLQLAHDLYYPWIKQGVKNYIDAYMNSKAPILILMGVPGSGKTTLSRTTAARVNDVLVLSNPKVIDHEMCLGIVEQLTRPRLIAIEEGSNMLKSRESGNSQMAEFLTTTDGIIPLDGRKWVITCNLTSTKDIDPAILRPSRTADLNVFRLLTQEEALAIVNCPEAYGKEPSDKDRARIQTRSQWSLADVLNDEEPWGCMTTRVPTALGYKA